MRRYITLPTDEPPPDVLDAIRKVVSWARRVEEEKMKKHAEYQHALQSMKAPEDWRDML